MEANKAWEEQKQVQLIQIANKELSVKELNGLRVVTFKDIDMLHERVEGTANKRFLDNQKHFIKNTDYFEFTGEELKAFKRLPNFGIGLNASKLILITESGYLMLVKSLTDDLAWKVQRELVNNYFTVKQVALNTNQLSPELQMFSKIFNAVAQVELSNNELKQEVQAIKEHNEEQIQSMRDVITLDHNSWREDCRRLISKIALKLGGYQYIGDVTKEIYGLMDTRLSSRLSVRLTNKRNRMAGEGVSKSKRDKLNYLDVISEDKKLIEGYKAIVKEMSIKYGVA